MLSATGESSNPTTATSSGTTPTGVAEHLEGRGGHRVVGAEDARPGRGGARGARAIARRAALLAEVPADDERLVRAPGRPRQRLAEALVAVPAGAHVERPGDRRDVSAAETRAGARWRGGRLSCCRRRRCGVPGDQALPADDHRQLRATGSTAGARRRRAARAAARRRRAGGTGSSRRSRSAVPACDSMQDQLPAGLVVRGADPAHDAGEERLAEDPLLRLRDDQRHGVRAPRHERPRRGVRARSSSSATASRTAWRLRSETLSAPLITRDAVPRPTPAQGRDLLEGRPAGGRARHGVSMALRWARTNSPYQRPLLFTVRLWVA